MELKACRDRSIKIREQYHQLEERFHGSRWTVEEDTLAFLTDAGLVGRLTMAAQGRWPSEEKDRLAAESASGGWRYCPSGRIWILPLVWNNFWKKRKKN